MQDTQTGELVPIPDDRQETKNKALPPQRQGPVFRVGEEIDVKGGRFVVASLGRKAMVLRGLPGTVLS